MGTACLASPPVVTAREYAPEIQSLKKAVRGREWGCKNPRIEFWMPTPSADAARYTMCTKAVRAADIAAVRHKGHVIC
jgi:hypothetical protein